MKKLRGISLILLLFVAFGLARQPSAAERPFSTPTPQFQPADPTTNRLLCDLDNLSACHANMLRDYLPPFRETAVSAALCIDNMADGTYPCDNVHLQSFLPLSDMGGGSGSDLWGWTDPDTDREYAIMTRTNGTSFIDITEPQAPIYLGDLPTHTDPSVWRDVKVYQNHAFIVADDSGAHGMQIFDLTQLRAVASPPVTFSETAHYDEFGSAHNVFINEESGYAYIVRIISGTNRCGGGLHMVNIQEPTEPEFAGCFSNGRFTHDTQCVNYAGPDPDYQGTEICFNANESAFNIVDVTDKDAPVDLGNSFYPGISYAHQGWLTDDHRYFLLNDELDESDAEPLPRTFVWDVTDLDTPQLVDTYTGVEPAIDHNMYINDGLLFQTNYRSGLRVLTLGSDSVPALQEVGYFDTFPTTSLNELRFNGAWSSYPFFASGNIPVSGIEHGLFILSLDDAIRDVPDELPTPDIIYLPYITD